MKFIRRLFEEKIRFDSVFLAISWFIIGALVGLYGGIDAIFRFGWFVDDWAWFGATLLLSLPFSIWVGQKVGEFVGPGKTRHARQE